MTENRPVVIDYGSFFLAAGFGGDDSPRTVFPAKIGHKRANALATSNASTQYGEVLLGEDVLKVNQNTLVLKFAVERGDIIDWDHYEKMLHHCFYGSLLTSSETQPLLITECVKYAPKNRERLVQLAFESFAVPKLCVANSSMLALLSTGRSTGMMLECGHGISSAIPVIDGQVYPFAAMFLNLAGADVTSYLAQLLNQRGYSFTKPSDLDLLRATKEKKCFVLADDKSSHDGPATSESGRQLVDLQLEEQWKATEILFNPTLLGDYAKINNGLDRLVHESISRCDESLQREFYSNIIVCGGTSMLPGFAERLKQELTKLTDYPVNVIAEPGRHVAAWTGGSIYASLDDFENACVTKSDYDEIGSSVSRRFF